MIDDAGKSTLSYAGRIKIKHGGLQQELSSRRSDEVIEFGEEKGIVIHFAEKASKEDIHAKFAELKIDAKPDELVLGQAASIFTPSKIEAGKLQKLIESDIVDSVHPAVEFGAIRTAGR